MLNIFPLVRSPPERTIPRNTGLILMLLWLALRFWRKSRINTMRNEPFSPTPTSAKGRLKVSGKSRVATAIFQHGQGGNECLGFKPSSDLGRMMRLNNRLGIRVKCTCLQKSVPIAAKQKRIIGYLRLVMLP